MGLKTGGYIKVEDMRPFHVASQKNFFRHAEKFYLVKINWKKIPKRDYVTKKKRRAKFL